MKKKKKKMMMVMMMTMTMTMMTIRRAHPVFLFPYKALHLKILSALEWDDWIGMNRVRQSMCVRLSSIYACAFTLLL